MSATSIWLAVAVAVVIVVAAARSSLPRAARRALHQRRPLLRIRFRKVMPPMSQTEREALEAGTVWWDGELFSGRPDWQQAARRSPQPTLTRGGAALPRPRGRDAVRDGHRLGDDERLQGPAAARLAVHQGPRLPRHDHPEGVRRPRLLRLRAFAGHHEAVDALRHRRGHGDGAELARPGRAAAPLRHRRAEAPLPAAPRARRSRFPASR